jgi:hypothetical protein
MRNLKAGYLSQFREIGQIFATKLGFKTDEFSKSSQKVQNQAPALGSQRDTLSA